MMRNPGATSEAMRSYDVFLSFRGEDTRGTYTVFLYNTLRQKGFKTFMDNENLRTGETIRPQLVKAIEESKIAFVVLSENYAASTWCLDELVKILECQKKTNQSVCPIFYKVEPSDVRHQKNSYGKAMAAHEGRFGSNSDKVRKWRSALHSVSEISGYPVKQGYEFESIQDIVSDVATKVSPKQLHVEENAVGLQFRVAELKPFLDIEYNNNTLMLGILGPGGIGKTTLAKTLYNSICNQFEGSSFIFNVRKSSNKDKGRVHLQKMLLSETLEGEKVEFGSVDNGISIIQYRLCTKKVLIVLDDVDKIDQLKELAGGCEWFGPGSRIIITTRDRSLLVAHQVKKIYDMRLLDDRESLELFCHNAFKTNGPATNYEALSNRAICYAKGLPLALQVIGSNLFGKDLKQWKSALDKYENNPQTDIQSILRISYDDLEQNEKDIFLDIACFFNGQRLRYVKRILDGCQFYTKVGIGILVDKSLVSVEDGCLRMHDLIQDMGREIVKQEAPKEAGERSRLWLCQDVRGVLTENMGSSKIEGILLDCNEVYCTDTAFEKMKKLRIFIVRKTTFSFGPIYLPNQLRLLDWKGYPSKSFPPSFYPKEIAAFNLSCSSLVLDKPFQKFDHLTYMNFSYCQFVTQFPDVSGAKNLRELLLNRCKKLVKVHESVGFLHNLAYLSVSQCTQLTNFPQRICLPSLKYLSFDLCRRLAQFPEVVGEMNKPLKICMKHTAITELPHSFANLLGLEHLDMTSCSKLQNLPSSFFFLPELVTLKIGGCSHLRESLTRFLGNLSVVKCWPNLGTLHFSNASLSDEDLHIIMQSFPNLKDLNVSSNYVESFPACVKESICLTSLDVSYCMKLQKIPALPSSVQKVDARHCSSLAPNTSSMLWLQVRKEIHRLEVVMPGSYIPQWFDYWDQGGIPIFWARGKFPVVALALVFEKVVYEKVGLHLFINGELVHVQNQQDHKFTVAEDHVLLCDLRVLFSDEGWKWLDARVGADNDWKRVQVKCESEVSLKQWGFFVYKQGTSMDDIQFRCPYPELSLARSVLEYTDLIIPLNQEDEEEVASVVSSGHAEDLEAPIQEEEEEHVPGCSSILFKIVPLFDVFKFKTQEKPEKPMENKIQEEAERQPKVPVKPKPKKPEKPVAPDKAEESEKLEEKPKPNEPEILEDFPFALDEEDVRFEEENFPFAVDDDVSFEEEEKNGDVDEQVPPTFSETETLQTLVENFKRAVAQKLVKGAGLKLEDGDDKGDYILESVAENSMLSSDDDDDGGGGEDDDEEEV